MGTQSYIGVELVDMTEKHLISQWRQLICHMTDSDANMHEAFPNYVKVYKVPFKTRLRQYISIQQAEAVLNL
jgi:N-acetyl-gamma-glutamylphosphate reductase